MVVAAGRSPPAVYQRGPEDFRRLITRKDVDAVIIATPWEWHVPMAVAAMKAGKFPGVEVPAAVTVNECWELVDTSESTGIWCMMLENACYRRNLMLVLNMVRQGRFGELLHGASGYQHDSRESNFNAAGHFTEREWYTWHAATRDGNLYPTHPVGPIAQCMNIDRGDRFTRLVSMSSKSIGLNDWIRRKHGPDHINATRRFALGDINTTMIKTATGATVCLYYDTHTPRPFDYAFRIQGTGGLYEMCRESVFLEAAGAPSQWETIEQHRQEYEHPLWQTLGEKAHEHGGGVDYVMLYQFVKGVITQTAPEQDVYDAATWSVIGPLSEQSVADGSIPVEFPDFTRGKWRTRDPIPILSA